MSRQRATALASASFAFAVAAVWLGELGGGVDFCLDDAWIHLAYARSLQLGEGFSYNPHDWETGSSSPLWAWLLALQPPGPSLVLRVKLLGMLLHALVAVLSGALACAASEPSGAPDRRPSPPECKATGPLAAGLVACFAHLLQAATSGMEVTLAAALLLGAALATLRGRVGLAFALGALATLARPEALFFVGALGAPCFFRERDGRQLAGLAGALSALLGWMLTCLLVSGYPWPNTRYVKAAAEPWKGLAYLGEEVLLSRPWVLAGTGVLLLGLALWRGHGRVRALMLAWGASVLLVSLTRELRPGGLFFLSRYFLIFAPVPIVCFVAALPTLRSPLLRWAAVLPVAAVTIAQWPEVRSLQRATEQDIAELHTRPAQHLARLLPADARVLVEGAGALRYFTPRTMRIVDIVGLNHRAIAHAPSDLELCRVLVAERPTHAALPGERVPLVRSMFELRLLARAVDAEHHSGRAVFPRELGIFEVRGLTREARAECFASTSSGSE